MSAQVSLKEVEAVFTLGPAPTIIFRPLSPAGCFLMGEVAAILRARKVAFEQKVTNELVEIIVQLATRSPTPPTPALTDGSRAEP